MTTKALNPVLIRMAGGTLGGFTLGFLSGIFVDIGTPNALSFGLFCAIAGLLAATAGHFLFSGVSHSQTVRSILNYAVIGAVFFVALSLFTPGDLAASMNIGSPLASLVAGLLAGGVGGALFAILLGGYAER